MENLYIYNKVDQSYINETVKRYSIITINSVMIEIASCDNYGTPSQFDIWRTIERIDV